MTGIERPGNDVSSSSSLSSSSSSSSSSSPSTGVLPHEGTPPCWYTMQANPAGASPALASSSSTSSSSATSNGMEERSQMTMSATIPYDGAVVVSASTTTPTTASPHNEVLGNTNDDSIHMTATDMDTQKCTKSKASPPLNPLWAQMTGLRLSFGWRASYNAMKIGADRPLTCHHSECETFYWNRFDPFSFHLALI